MRNKSAHSALCSLCCNSYERISYCVVAWSLSEADIHGSLSRVQLSLLDSLWPGRVGRWIGCLRSVAAAQVI